MEWFVYEQERYETSEKAFVVELVFYAVELSPASLQFKEYPKQKPLRFIGVYSGYMPVEYPMKLDSGIVIPKGKYWVHNGSDE